MNVPAVELRQLSKNFGASKIIQNINLTIAPHENHAIIGPNGAGKSTLLNLITGKTHPTSGSILINNVDIRGKKTHQINRMGLSRSFQVSNIFPQMTVFENIRCALLWSMGYKYSFWQLIDRQKELTRRTEALLERLHMGARRNDLAGVLSYAEQRLLEIGITMAGGSTILLLDEPTAGLNQHESEHVVEFLQTISKQKTLIIIEHDMKVVFNLAERISVLVYGQIIATGTPIEIRQNAQVQETYLGPSFMQTDRKVQIK